MTRKNHEDNRSYLDHLKTKIYGGKTLIDWENCLGETFEVKFNGERFEVEITDYEKRNGKNKYIKLKSEPYGEKWVEERRIKAAQYGYYTTNPVMGFLYEVGQVVHIKGQSFEVLEAYREDGRWEKMYQLKCLTCGGKSSKPEIEIRNQVSRCGVCSGKVVDKGINDIATHAPWMIDLLADPEDAFKYTPYSHQSIFFKCPNCGDVQERIVSNVYYQGLSCKCLKHNSIPERFCFSILKHLNVCFSTEHYIEDRRFDFWIESLNLIIETHGKQHYIQTKRPGARTLEEEQANDEYKKQLAKDANVEHYIVIDCRKSQLNFLKQQFLNSELTNFFDLDKVDWQQVFRSCQTSIGEWVVDLHNQGYTRAEIAEELGISKATAGKYVREGAASGLLKDFKHQHSKSSKNYSVLKYNPVKHLETGAIFLNATEAAAALQKTYGENMVREGITRAAKGELEHYKGLHFEKATKEEFLAFQQDESFIMPTHLKLPIVKRKDTGSGIKRSVDFSQLPTQATRKGDIIQWDNTIGLEIPFTYGEIKGVFKIESLERINSKNYLTLSHSFGEPLRIEANQLRNGSFGKIFTTKKRKAA